MIKNIIISLAILFVSTSFMFSQQVMSVTGSVIDQTTRNAASVIVTFYDKSNKKIGSSKSNSATGFYLVTGLKQGEKYKVQLESPDYFKDEYEIQLPVSKKYADISRDFTVKPVAKGVKILLEVSPFELKKSKFRVGSEDYLADIVKLMTLNPGISIEIQSYPDSEGDLTFNQKFTEERANAIKAYLTENGVKDSRIAVKSSGAVDPVNPPPKYKTAKGKRYIGPIYIVVTRA